MISQIKQELQELIDEEYAKFNQKLCPDTNKKMLGIRIPKLRKLAQKIVKQYEWKAVLEKLDETYFEEVLLKGLMIGYAPIPIDEKL